MASYKSIICCSLLSWWLFRWYCLLFLLNWNMTYLWCHFCYHLFCIKLTLFLFLALTFFTAIVIDVNRWQDGAIVADNPTIFAIREAQLLWPDTKIDSLVSIGCGSIPTKVNFPSFDFERSINSRFISWVCNFVWLVTVR